MDNIVISLCDKNYFNVGKLFLQTRKRIKAKFIVYAPDLTSSQIDQLSSHSIEHKIVSMKRFEKRMQCMKFELLLENIDDTKGKYGLSFVDFDTLFLSDWREVFKNNFNLGITVRNDFIKKKRAMRAFTNGGVIFSTNSTKSADLCRFALEVMEGGGSDRLPEYDRIFKEFEPGSPRSKNKTWKRSDLRWWVDQVFLSSFILKNGCKTVKNKSFHKFEEYDIGLFNCNIYNRLDPAPSSLGNLLRRGVKIVHLKTKGRDRLRSFSKQVKKLGIG